MTRTVLYVSDLAILGGGEICMLAMIDQLDRARFRPVVVAPGGGPLVDAARARGLEVREVKLHEGMRFWRIRRYSPLLRMERAKNLARLERIVAEEGVDLVHTHGGMYPENIAYLGRIARRAGIPVAWECGYGAVYRPEIMRELIAPWVDQVIAVSNSVRDKLLEAGWPDADRIEVLHHGLDLAAWRREDARRDGVRLELGAAPGDVLFGMVGRVVAIKGHDTFLAAARRVIDVAPRARFVVVGDQRPVEGTRGRYFRALVDEVDRSGLAGRFVMAGWRDDVPAVMNALDVLVQPSREEAFGRTLLEAMALARPVIAARAGGMPEVVAHRETGLLVPPGDAGALAEAVLELAGNDALRASLGQGGRERVVRRFDLAARTRRVEALYDRLAPAADVRAAGGTR